MGKCKTKCIGITGTLLVWLLAYVQFAQPSYSFRLPMGGVASQKRLQEGNEATAETNNGQYNVSYVPLLLDLAKEIGRFQFSQSGYYIQNEPLPSYPGLDLRWLLFSQSSPLTLPEGLSAPNEVIPSDKASGPTLAVPNITSNKGEPLPNAQVIPPVPQLAVSPLSCEVHPIVNFKPPTQITSPEKIRLAMPEHKLNSLPTLISVDFQGLSAALTGIGNPDHNQETIAIAPHRFSPIMGNTLPVSQAPHNCNTAFLLWTIKPASISNSTNRGAKDFSSNDQSALQDKYQGTFVACMPGVRFKSIHSRIFELQKGRLLAGNRGDNLVIACDVADVTLPEGASAIIDLSERQVLRVIALESEGQSTISIKAKNLAQGEKVLSIAKGEELVIANEALSDKDVIGDDGLLRKPLVHLHNLVRNQIIISQVLEKEHLLNPQIDDLTGQQRSAIVGLREKVAD